MPNRLRIEHGVSRTERVKLQVTVDKQVADDLDLLASWSDNEKNYVANELLRFAIAEAQEFQRYKADRVGIPNGSGADPVASHTLSVPDTAQSRIVSSSDTARSQTVSALDTARSKTTSGFDTAQGRTVSGSDTPSGRG